MLSWALPHHFRSHPTHPASCVSQVLPNGSRRPRGLPLSEKLLPGERWQEAVVRGVVEELGPVLPTNPQVGARSWVPQDMGWGVQHQACSGMRHVFPVNSMLLA